MQAALQHLAPGGQTIGGGAQGQGKAGVLEPVLSDSHVAAPLSLKGHSYARTLQPQGALKSGSWSTKRSFALL